MRKSKYFGADCTIFFGAEKEQNAGLVNTVSQIPNLTLRTVSEKMAKAKLAPL
jgi:hypothetical protein